MAGTMKRAGQPNGRRDEQTQRARHTEGVVAQTIEEQTAKLPSDFFLWAAGASMFGSCSSMFRGGKTTACSSASGRRRF